jgi:hypothetical protein
VASGRAGEVTRLLAFLLAAVVLAFAGGRASAHSEAWLTATAEIRRDGAFVVDVVVSRELVGASFGATAPPADVAGLPPAPDIVRESRGTMAAFGVVFDGSPAATVAEWVACPEESLHFRLTGRVPESARTIAFRNDARFGPWACAVRHEGETGEKIAFLRAGQPMTPVELREGFAPKPALATIAEFVGFGFTHILPLGLDHVLFVLGLFLASTRLRPLLLQVTAFTVAHTVTLGLSATGVVRLPASIVEPLIAASIVYVAVENLCKRDVGWRRVLLVFAFGLLHGLGFAGALAELGLPPGRKAVALVSFNIGVELGQLAVMLTAWVLLALPFKDKPWYRARIVVPASFAIAAVGAYWAVTRVIGV